MWDLSKMKFVADTKQSFVEHMITRKQENVFAIFKQVEMVD